MSCNIKKTIFDSLMISDSERVHTQTLAWILSLEPSIFPNDCKSKFLKELFNLNCDVDIKKDIYIETELNFIDLFIETDNKQFIIENKLKSSEHSDQTDKYLKSIPKEFQDDKKEKHYGFLSLIKESPINNNWLAISFEKLHKLLSGITWDESIKETIFIEEYLATLKNLVSVFNEFMKNHTAFSNVFIDGPKKKYVKKVFSDRQKDYIRSCQLETIFQKAFLKSILDELKVEKYELSETRGTALFQFHFEEISIDEKNIFRIGLQFQGNTLKINLIHNDYARSNPEQMGGKLRNAFKQIYLNKNDYNKFNSPRSKAYISVSKKLNKELYEIEKQELVELLKKEIEDVKASLVSFKYLCFKIQ